MPAQRTTGNARPNCPKPGSALALYRTLLTLAAPMLLLMLLLRRLLGRETTADLRQRLGRAPASPQPCLWLHGASNGELTAARPLITALLAACPDHHLLLTANTTTGRDMALAWGLPRTTALLAPLDLRRPLRRFLSAHQPRALITVENELWPNRLTLAHAQGIPVILTSARLSARSAARWAKLPGLAHGLLENVSLLSAQDHQSAARFAALGLPESARTAPLALKAATTLAAPDPDELARLSPHFIRGETLLAASTHAEDEAALLPAFIEARKTRPALRLILAPRHARRGAEVSRALTAANLPHATRSAGEAPADHPVFLADTMGEMPLWYALSGTCFVGGTLADKGGHTPREPAAAGCAILHGPSTFNQAEIFASLDASGAALTVTDAPSLAAALAALTPERQSQMAAAAAAPLAQDNAELAPLVANIRRILLAS